LIWKGTTPPPEDGIVNKIAERFFLRSEFESFRLDPARNPVVLFGKEDRSIRDKIKNGLRLASKSGDSEKYVLFGVAGRGKTQLAYNLAYIIGKEKLDLFPVYSKCESYSQKAYVTELYWDLVKGLGSQKDALRSAITEAARKLKGDAGLRDRITPAFGSDTTLNAVVKGLQAPDDDFVLRTLSWVAGREEDMSAIGATLPSNITEVATVSQVLGGLAELVYVGSGRILTIVLDEAERLDQVTSKDSDKEFGAALREICSLRRLGLVFLTIAREPDEIPFLLQREEIKRRITVGNFLKEDLLGHNSVANFVAEYLRGVIEKGDSEQPVTANPQRAKTLEEMLKKAGEPLESFPFTQSAFKAFISNIAGDPQISKPSEIIARVAKCVSLADDFDKAFVDDKIVAQVFESA
jgi:hypothetical protein